MVLGNLFKIKSKGNYVSRKVKEKTGDKFLKLMPAEIGELTKKSWLHWKINFSV